MRGLRNGRGDLMLVLVMMLIVDVDAIVCWS